MAGKSAVRQLGAVLTVEAPPGSSTSARGRDSTRPASRCSVSRQTRGLLSAREARGRTIAGWGVGPVGLCPTDEGTGSPRPLKQRELPPRAYQLVEVGALDEAEHRI